jgi:transglutaminase-like putative cysteine protease
MKVISARYHEIRSDSQEVMREVCDPIVRKPINGSIASSDSPYYLGDIGVPRDPAPMDFSAWFEVFIGGRWFTFDARHNHSRVGRIVIARGRDAADVAISTSFRAAILTRFSREGIAKETAPPP